MSTAGIVFAAGFSRRLGRPKQTLQMGGEWLVVRAVRVALQAELRPVLVVVQPEADFAEALQVLGCTLVRNPAAQEGLATSIRAGVLAAAQDGEVSGAVLMTCDQIGVTAEHLRRLCAEPERVTGSAYAGKVAVPAYFPRSWFDQLIRLQGEAGARDLLRGATAVENEDLALDIDTEEDVRRARELVER